MNMPRPLLSIEELETMPVQQRWEAVCMLERAMSSEEALAIVQGLSPNAFAELHVHAKRERRRARAQLAQALLKASPIAKDHPGWALLRRQPKDGDI
jgi:hypothetical protein